MVFFSCSVGRNFVGFQFLIYFLCICLSTLSGLSWVSLGICLICKPPLSVFILLLLNWLLYLCSSPRRVIPHLRFRCGYTCSSTTSFGVFLYSHMLYDLLYSSLRLSAPQLNRLCLSFCTRCVNCVSLYIRAHLSYSILSPWWQLMTAVAVSFIFMRGCGAD